MIIKPNEHYFLEIDSKILNNFIENNIFECPNKNELFNSLTQGFSKRDKYYLSLAVIGILEKECRNVTIEDVWYWLCKSSEIVVFKSKNAYKSQEQYDKLYKDINSEYLIDFKYEDIIKIFQNLSFEPVTQEALNKIGIENLVNIYKKDLQRRQNFEPKQIFILLKFNENLVCIKLEYMNNLYDLVTPDIPLKPYSVLEISDNNLIYDIAYKSNYNKSLLKKLMQKWHKRDDVLDKMQNFFTYFCCLYKEELDSFLESYNK